MRDPYYDRFASPLEDYHAFQQMRIFAPSFGGNLDFARRHAQTDMEKAMTRFVTKANLQEMVHADQLYVDFKLDVYVIPPDVLGKVIANQLALALENERRHMVFPEEAMRPDGR